MEKGYLDKVGAMLCGLKFGEVFFIDKNVKPATRSLFVEVVKSYIDRGLGSQEGWCIEFNGSLDDPRRPVAPTKIRKINISLGTNRKLKPLKI